MTTGNSGFSTRIEGLLAQELGYESLFERLRAGHTLVTANSRLSRVLTGQYNQWRIGQGDVQWQSPDILSWNLWLDSLWDQAALQGIAGTDRAVPGSRQLINLWESTLKHEAVEHTLLRPESLAKQLRETRRLIIDWQLDLDDPAWFGSGNENHSAFRQWKKAFEKRCERDGWICPEDRTVLLVNALREHRLTVDQDIELLGFDEYNPAQKSLLSAMAEGGVSVCHLVIASRQNDAVLLKCKDRNEELQRAARWVRYWFEQDPGSTIAVVVPDLHERCREVERQLREILTPGSTSASMQTQPWNISMGVPLAQLPIIESVFDLFKLFDTTIDIQDIGRVLRSPWLRGAGAERNSRALLEKCLRDNYPRQLKRREIGYRAGEIRTHDRQHHALPPEQQEPKPWNSPDFCAILDSLNRFDSEHGGLQQPSAWATAIDGLLVRLGWPLADESGNAATKTEYEQNWQALQAWRDALRELTTLDATVNRFGRNAAIKQLKQICQEKIFQPRTPAASIQVLGLYEISGLRFDHLWVVGLHAGNWPSGARPNPFIPGRLQTEGQLPNSSPQRELDVARQVTRRLLETAPDCVFSYPGKIDADEVLPSPLLDSDEIRKVEELPGWNGHDWRGTVARGDKPQIQPLSMPGKLEYETARGGSSILKHQALCPFRAFASNRLGAEGLETPVDGISAMLHGSLVHSVLEYFWQETKNRSNLLELDEETLSRRVHKHIEKVTGEERGLKQRPAFCAVEAARLHRHVLAFLELEKTRDDFEVIGFEEEIFPDIMGQTIRLIIDRIDSLPSGEQIIIDYKTGPKAPREWFGDRPEDPQLPLYAISAENTPTGVAFGIIRDDGCLYKGVVRHDGLLPGLPPKATKTNQYLIDAGENLPNTIENWRQTLHRLMADFLAGEAAIDPKDGTNTCRGSYCQLQALCRIGELEQLHRTRQREDIT
jgi:probable DNA repair protein